MQFQKQEEPLHILEMVFFDVRTWGHRYTQYKGMNLRRVVPENMLSQELEIAKTSKKVAKNVGMF